jgi:hypothetical protein
MQDAETVLSVLRERGGKGLPLTQLYRQMFNRTCTCCLLTGLLDDTPGMVDALEVGWPVELTRLFRRETRGAVGWVRRAGYRLGPVAAVGPGR